MTSLIEAHFSGMTSQSSIYGLTSLLTGASSHKVLMASSKRKVYCIEYSRNNKSLIPSTREVQFTYIPGGAEIISIDAFNQACQEHDFVVGIAFVKSDSGGKRTQYFNIYSDWEPSNECILDNIAQGCLSIGLDFIPFHLTHTELLVNKDKEMVWLLSGSDCKIHLYREDKSHQTYCEEPSSVCFPEFENLPSVVLWMDFLITSTSRLAALGCKDGCVIVTMTKLIPEIKVVSSWSVQHDGLISVVRLFHDSSVIKFQSSKTQSDTKDCSLNDSINLAVGNTLEISVIYRDVLKKGLSLSSQWFLPHSKKFDCITCCLVADIDMDGNNELIFGTYGQQLLVYKWHLSNDSKGEYNVFHQQAFPNPLLAISYTDITGDGLKELLVLTTKGLHILQHNLEKAANLCIFRLKNLIENIPKDEIKMMFDDDMIIPHIY